ncbi:MAG TPA: cytochrome c3 family protein, partial [Holophagaceae bacterium]
MTSRLHLRGLAAALLGLGLVLAGASLFPGGAPAPQDCGACHAKVVALETSPTAHQPLRQGHCRWCHKPHGEANVNILHAGGGRDLCVICHKPMARAAGERPAHTFERSGECLACHEAHDSGRKNLLRKEPQALCLGCHAEVAARVGRAHGHPSAKESCLNCHDPHPSARPFLLNAAPAELCVTCHDPGDLQKPHGGMKPAAGSCLTCHDPHGSADKGMPRDQQHPPFKDRECADCHVPGPAGQPALTEPPPGLCAECHQEVPGKGKVHAPVAQGKCLACHLPHASATKGVLRKPVPALCLDCHRDLAKGDSAHPPFQKGACLDCHRPHSS